MQVERHPRPVGRQSGVTLVETLAAIGIVGILSGVVWVAVAGRVKTAAKQTQIKSDMRQVVMAVNLYRGDNDGGLPSNWQYFGYYKVVKKGAYGGGYPLQDMYNPNPPTYDVSYHTPECARPPKASMGFLMFRQAVALFESRPRASVLDVERDQAVRFGPACLANSYAERHLRVLEGGSVHTPLMKGYRSLGASLSGTISYQYDPEWFNEAAVGF